MKRLLRYLNDYKKESVLAPLFKMLEASFELFVPLVVAQIVDVGIKNQEAGYILKMGGLLVLLGVIGLTCSITAQYFAAKSAVGFATGLRNDLFAHIGSLSYSEQDTIGTSTLITRMTSDINQVQSGVNLTLRLLLRSPFIVFGAMIMAFTVNARAAMVFVVAIPVLSIIVFGIMAISMPLYKKVQKQLDHVTQATRENLTGARVIRAFNRQEDEIRNFDESNSLLVKFQVFVGKISALMNPMTYVVVNLSIIAVVWISGKQVDAGIITQGETVALVNYMSQILVELIKMANLIVSISKALACANRISAVLEEKSSIVSPAKGMEQAPVTDAEGADAPAKVRFDHVNFLYKGAKADSLTDISLTVKKGQTIGIIGGTGSGKSSLVNLIPRFYDVREGAVFVDGVNVKDYRLETLREKIGVMFGNPETTTGGRALKFYASVRLDVRRTEALKQSGEVVGNHTRVKVVKNKIAPPFKEAEFDIVFGKGISTDGDILDLAAECGIIAKSGAWYAYNDAKIGQGRENAKQFLHDNPEIRDEVEMRVREHYGLPVPEEFRQTETGAEAAKDRSDLELS